MRAYEQLEIEWAQFNGLDPAGMVACSSGTAALHLALEALRLPQGSKVIVPDYSMIACARAVTLAGLEPVFVDCNEKLLVDPARVAAAVRDAYDGNGNSDWKPGRRVSAVVPVNVYGREYDVFGVRKATEPYGVKVIEDLAEAHGVKPSYNADAACWSFYSNKIVHGEEGGAVWFRDPEHARLARLLRCQGFTLAHDYTHVPRGHNYRLADSLARLVIDSLRAFPLTVARRRRLEHEYDRHCPAEWKMPPRDAPWVYDLRIPGIALTGQALLVNALHGHGVPARYGFKPLSGQEEYRRPGVAAGEQASAAAREVIYLPLGEEVSEAGPAQTMTWLREAWREIGGT